MVTLLLRTSRRFSQQADVRKPFGNPAPDQGDAFSGWQGACTGTSLTCTVTLSSPANVSARFVKHVGTMTAT
jgi:hypothetical protein